MTIQQAKEMDMVNYLSALGHEPTKISGKSYWYLSPLHEKKTASFKVNKHLNRWYDFADGKGGNLIDFGVQYFNISVGDFLKKINALDISMKLTASSAIQNLTQDENQRHINILSAHYITSYPLLKYLQERRINNEISQKYLQEVRYEIGGKIYYALGFKNDAGGYELRNEHFKGSSSPKDVTLINNGSQHLAVFEGFFNFLSYQNLYHNQQQQHRNFLILNSTSFFEKSLTIMQEYKRVHLYLDNDKTGNKCTLHALSLNADRFQDERRLYQKYDDLNDWLMNIGKSLKQQLKPGH